MWPTSLNQAKRVNLSQPSFSINLVAHTPYQKVPFLLGIGHPVVSHLCSYNSSVHPEYWKQNLGAPIYWRPALIYRAPSCSWLFMLCVQISFGLKLLNFILTHEMDFNLWIFSVWPFVCLRPSYFQDFNFGIFFCRAPCVFETIILSRF